MLRWGWTNVHRYDIYVGSSKEEAEEAARFHSADRGGKYAGWVQCWDGQTWVGHSYTLSSREEEGPEFLQEKEDADNLGEEMWHALRFQLSQEDVPPWLLKMLQGLEIPVPAAKPEGFDGTKRG